MQIDWQQVVRGGRSATQARTLFRPKGTSPLPVGLAGMEKDYSPVLAIVPEMYWS